MRLKQYLYVEGTQKLSKKEEAWIKKYISGSRIFVPVPPKNIDLSMTKKHIKFEYDAGTAMVYELKKEE